MSFTKKRIRNELSPTQYLSLVLLIIIIMGTFLLNTPIATVSNESIGGINALFTATSAVCITGLTIFDTATTFSLFGRQSFFFLFRLVV